MKKFIPSVPMAVQGLLVTFLGVMIINRVPAIARLVGPKA